MPSSEEAFGFFTHDFEPEPETTIKEKAEDETKEKEEKKEEKKEGEEDEDEEKKDEEGGEVRYFCNLI